MKTPRENETCKFGGDHEEANKSNNSAGLGVQHVANCREEKCVGLGHPGSGVWSLQLAKAVGREVSWPGLDGLLH